MLPTSGEIWLHQIIAEFGNKPDANGITWLDQYYGVDAGVPTSGAIELSQFYGKANVKHITFSASTTTLSHFNMSQWVAQRLPNAQDARRVVLTIPSNYRFLSSNATYYGLYFHGECAGRELTVINYAQILGAGGHGGGGGNRGNGLPGQAGGNALYINPNHGCSKLVFNNQGIIYAGGGGAGGGAAGGHRNNKSRIIWYNGGNGGIGQGHSSSASPGSNSQHRSYAGHGGHGGAYGNNGANGGNGQVRENGPTLNYYGGAGGIAGIAINGYHHRVSWIGALGGNNIKGRII
ncbi:hypothetical protein KCM76_22965 [Zooshikella marina]|uniref:hypothetical protein n=1 Tax=Zooshikella ganghwensis TaxID=202772 RepID=UPI001BB01357|nr:hypothetical protein [Zooshikella ganghwensis]MBU2708874.1 hypothetical protein [Zooshikella ganghwensis]